MVDRNHVDIPSASPLGSAPHTGPKSTAKVPPSRDFRDTQTLSLPLDRVCPPDDPHVRMMRLRESAVHGSFEQRVHFLLNEVFVRTPDVQHVLSVSDQLLELATLYPNPGGLRVVAESGMGKDALIRYQLRQHPPQLVGRQPVYPLLHVRLAQRPHAGDVLKTLLNQTQCVYNGRTLDDLKKSALDAMDSCEVKGVIFNEANHMASAAHGGARIGARLAGEFGDWVKEFIDDIKRPVFFFGVPGWDEVFDLGKQLGTRIPHHYEIQNLQLDQVFVTVLKTLDQAIPMPEPAGLTESAMVGKLHVASKGIWRHLIHLLRDAMIAASIRGSARIEEGDLYWAYRLQFGPNDNVFSSPKMK